MIHTSYDTPAERHRAPCFLSVVSLPPTAGVCMIVDSGPRWPTLDPAGLVSAVSAVRSAGVDVRFMLISGRSVPADVSASLQNVDSVPHWPTLDPASLVSAVSAVHSAGVDVRSLLISGRSAPADVSASLQNAHYENQR